MNIDSTDAIFQVVINGEEQYSIWFDDRPMPIGWYAVGQKGTKKECLEYIERSWTDMRPRSVRESLGTRRDQHASVTADAKSSPE